MALTLFADQHRKIYDHPGLELVGQSGREWHAIPEEDLVPLPEGSRLFTMEGNNAVGWDHNKKTYSIIRDVNDSSERINKNDCVVEKEHSPTTAVAAFLPPGYTRLYLPAISPKRERPLLPLWTYTAVGWMDQDFCAAAVRIDPMKHSDPCHYDDRVIVRRIEKRLSVNPENRLLHHLKHCALNYHCLAAKNLFMERWEAPLPSSPSCNATCVGCLSFQPKDGCTASHDRIEFIPSAEELVQVALPHLRNVPKGIVSFGQGCEGEPLLETDRLEEAIKLMRSETPEGTIHLNTNGFQSRSVLRLRQAGLDSIRISLNSARQEAYHAYYRPRGYTFQDVITSIQTAVDSGLYTSLNLLVFPGITDQEEEVSSLLELIRTTKIQMVQMRNLSIDPETYLGLFPSLHEKVIGIRNLIRLLQREFPAMEIGYFNRPKELFGKVLSKELPL